ncbi:MAG: PIN domain-containing protein [Planctomycetes bacterium]|nr:PIN domain-containing protein [Planctomycetota bacterium]MBU4398140.1 PIN domain-containing protein [Planctomycetota bacterium]MCG2682358.1 PIN domain-containing protein [Planctomycetales bacterium]
MKVFFDTNILLDVLARREPFYADSAKVWTLAETGRLEGFASTLSLPILFYLLCRSKGKGIARKSLGVVRDIFSLLPLDMHVADQALNTEMGDFEDAIQYFSAISAGVAVLLTRNPKDFPGDRIAIQTPEDFLAAYLNE